MSKRSLNAAWQHSAPMPSVHSEDIIALCLHTFSVGTGAYAAFVSNCAPPAGKAPATALWPITRLITESSDWTTDHSLSPLQPQLEHQWLTTAKCSRRNRCFMLEMTPKLVCTLWAICPTPTVLYRTVALMRCDSRQTLTNLICIHMCYVAHKHIWIN